MVAKKARLAGRSHLSREWGKRLLELRERVVEAADGIGQTGGNGIRFDWQLLGNFNPGMAWGLAGGIDAGNVGAAIAATAAPLVDVSSGVEDAPGVKSVEKIRAFVAAVRA